MTADLVAVNDFEVDDLEETTLVTVEGSGLPRFYISNSELKTWRRCRRKWWLGWYRALRPLVTNYASPMHSGNRVHRALALYYSGNRSESFNLLAEHAKIVLEDQTDLELGLRITGFDDDEGATYRTTKLLEFGKAVDVERAMLEGYLQWLSETGDDAQLELLSAETAVKVPLTTLTIGTTQVEVWLIGILDARVRRTIDGLRLFIDHKTVGSLSEPLKTLHMNTQMLHYLLMEQLVDPQPDHGGALYNMLRRVKRTTSAKPPFFRREVMTHNVDELDAYRAQVIAAARDILRTTAALSTGVPHNTAAYPNPTADCSWDCEFFSVCPLMNYREAAAEQWLDVRYKHEDPLARYENAVTSIPPLTVQ